MNGGRREGAVLMQDASHPHYMVDPVFLPAAGVRRCPPQLSASLDRRRQEVTRWHVQEQQRSLQRLGMAISGGATPRDLPGAAGRPLAVGEAAARGAGGNAGTGERPHATDTRLRGRTLHEPNGGGLDLLIDGLRRRILSKGLRTFAELERLYRDLDVDGSGFLSTAEFKAGLLELGVLRNDVECDVIFAYFDEDRSGYIDFSEFSAAIKGRLPEARRSVVQEAFAFLDANGDGVLEVEDLSSRFQAFKHPDVVAGCRTEQEVLGEFLELFDTICHDRRVSLSEFERYYEACSALIASDDFFIALVRSSWRLPGASGNSCMRVHITRGDKPGREGQAWRGDTDPRKHGLSGLGAATQQETVEIRPALGVSQHDPRFRSALLQRLGEMGYHDVVGIQFLTPD